MDKPENITVESIEDLISKDSHIPLRWAVVKADNSTITINATVVA